MARKELFTGYRLGSDRAPTVLQFFWDFTCPFSAKSFLFVTGTLAPAVESKSPGQFAFEFRHQVQPWHPQTVALHEAAIAAHRLKPEAFIPFARALFENLSSFMDDQTYSLSRSELYERAAALGPSVGLEKVSLLALLAYKSTPGESNAGNAVTNDFKVHLRIARQNGIHVSPTVLVNGLADSSIQSSWDLDTWTAYLAKLVEGD